MRKRILWAVLAAVVLLLFCLYWIGSIEPARITTSADAGARAGEEPRREISAPPIEVVAPDAPGLFTDIEVSPSKKLERADETIARAAGRGSGPYTFTLDVTALDGFDHALYGAIVYVGPALHRLDVAGMTDLSGRLSVVWRAHVPDMDLAVAVAGPRGTWSGLVRVRSNAETPCELRLTLPGEKRFEDPVEVEERLVQKFQGVDSDLARQWNELERGKGYGVRGTLPDVLSRAPSVASDGNERVFVADPAGSAEDAVAEFLETWRELRSHRELAKTTPVSSTDGDGARLVGSVVDAFGRPAVGALVALGEEPDSGLHGVYTNDAGRFEVDDVRAGTWYLRAGGGDQGLSNSFRALFHGETVEWDFVLDPGTEVAGELLDSTSEPLADTWVELVGAGPTALWNDFARTDENGRFTFQNVGEATLELRVHPWHPGEHYWRGRQLMAQPNGIPSVVAAVDRESSFAALREPGPALAALTLRFPEPDERSRSDEDVVEARVWQLETQRGVFAGAPQARSALLALPPGTYLIELGSAQRGWTQRQILLDAGESQTVEPRLPAGGSVTWLVERRSPAFDVYRLIELREDVNSIVATFDDRLPPSFLLPAGQYELVAFRGSAAELVIPFRVDDGHETVVRLVTQ